MAETIASSEKPEPIYLDLETPSEAAKLKEPEDYFWWLNFIATYLERNISQLGPRIPAVTLRNLWTMLAHSQGGQLNIAQLGNNLDVAAPTAKRYLELLEDLLLIRILRPWSGYFCLFKEEFIDSTLHTEPISQSPLFRINGDHVFFPDRETVKFLKAIFEKMLSELRSTYENKYVLLRNYVQIIIHEGLKIKPPDKGYHTGNSVGRICNLFLELLESQFPVVSPYHPLKLKSPSQMAGQLAIHPNHLNRAVREATGKTTSETIAARIVKEAKALLSHTDWDITTIGYCLGFGYSSNFNLYFKKHTGTNPSTFRRSSVANS